MESLREKNVQTNHYHDAQIQGSQTGRTLALAADLTLSALLAFVTIRDPLSPIGTGRLDK